MATSTDPNRNQKRDDNLDPITGEPGAHPVGTGIGAAGGATVGAAAGAAVGPVGAVVGAVVGGIVGGLTGKGFAEGLDPTAEDAYWRAEHPNQNYAEKGSYDDFAPAYRVGYAGHKPGAQFGESEEALRHEYEALHPDATIDWEDARPAAERAWLRAERLRAYGKA